MALQKDFETQYGITLSYWKVTRLNIEWHNRIAEVFLGGWVNRSARESEVAALEYKAVYFSTADFPFTPDGYNHTEAYERLKLPIFDNQDETQPDLNPFTEATDVFEAGQPFERP